MESSVKKDMLSKFDDFLSMFDVEELIRDGVSLVKFRYNRFGVDRTISLTPDQLKEIKNK